MIDEASAPTYKARRTVRTLRFEKPHELAGLVLRTRGLSVEEVLEVTGYSRAMAILQREVRAGDGGAALAAVGDLDVETPFKVLADKLIEWNMVDPDTGEPIPPTLAGIKSLESDELAQILREWIASFSGVSDDLKDGLSSGPSTAAVPLPMDPL